MKKSEYFRVKTNNVEKIILLFRDEKDYDKENTKQCSNMWESHITSLMKELLNVEDWEYLGDIESFHPEKGTNVIIVSNEQY